MMKGFWVGVLGICFVSQAWANPVCRMVCDHNATKSAFSNAARIELYVSNPGFVPVACGDKSSVQFMSGIFIPAEDTVNLGMWQKELWCISDGDGIPPSNGFPDEECTVVCTDGVMD